MAITSPAELRRFLDAHGLHAKKRLSQNFLIDGNILRKISEAASLSADDVVLEIGPGPGALSELILDSGATLIAVEKDRDFAAALERLQTSDHRLHIFTDDILKFPIEDTLRQLLPPGKKAKVIANLPYSLTTPILIRLTPLHTLLETLVVMVQEEVGRRMAALPRSADYGSLTVFLRFYSTPTYAFKVGRRCFYPAPRVDSAIVVLNPHVPPLSSHDTEAFFTFTRRAFQQRRKMMRASLKELYGSEKVEKSLIAIGQNPQARPEVLSLDDFLALFKLLS
jgi:16S rRNA (adenine1518-N6/adenine1519-N6)-dimethyltransferase